VGGAGLLHRLERLGADEGRVAVEDDRVAARALERRGGGEDGMGGALLLGLHGDGDGLVDLARGLGHGFGSVAHDEHGALRRAWANIGAPPISCRTLGRSDSIRVPCPAASTMSWVAIACSFLLPARVLRLGPRPQGTRASLVFSRHYMSGRDLPRRGACGR
jgi:hypothetical protein